MTGRRSGGRRLDRWRAAFWEGFIFLGGWAAGWMLTGSVLFGLMFGVIFAGGSLGAQHLAAAREDRKDDQG